jgi:hypothetical protein
MKDHIHECGSNWAPLRRMLDSYQNWTEATLGVALADIVIFGVDLNLVQIGVEKILAWSDRPDATSRAVMKVRPLLASAEIPPGFPPLLELNEESPKRALSLLLPSATFSDDPEWRLYFKWRDCPVALRFHRMTSPVIAWNYYFHFPPYINEVTTRFLIARRECGAEVLALVEHLYRDDP